VLAPVGLRRTTRGSLATGLAIGLVLGTAYYFQTLGLKYTTPTNSGLVTGLFILFVPLFDRVLFGLRMDRLRWLAVAACLGGTVLLIGQSPRELRTGDALTVVAAAIYGLHISLLSHHAARHDTFALTMAQMLAVALAAGIAWPMFEPLAAPTPAVWRALLITGLLASAVAFLIQTFVQSRLSAARTGIIITAEPLFAVLFGYSLAGDRLTAVQLVGAALLMGGIVTSEAIPAWRKTRASAGGAT